MLEQRLQHADERDFLVHGSIAHRYGDLAGEHANHFEMGFREKIRIGAFETERADAA